MRGLVYLQNDLSRASPAQSPAPEWLAMYDHELLLQQRMPATVTYLERQKTNVSRKTAPQANLARNKFVNIEPGVVELGIEPGWRTCRVTLHHVQ